MTFEKVASMLADYKGIDVSGITAETTFAEIKLDSLDVAELVMQIEDELGVSLEMSAEYNTVDKLLAYIESK